ncbi:MAG TPA: Mur ligase family protein [Acidimicrobiia bacterium]|nr:Mur ligase family protein [Acidimicrobiia bacterium]
MDEAFGTFERIHLDGLIVTNVEPEHLDYFETADRMEAIYADVAAGVTGPVVFCVDDPGSMRVMTETWRRGLRVVGYGFGREADWQIQDIYQDPGSVRFTLHGPGTQMTVSVPGPAVILRRMPPGPWRSWPRWATTPTMRPRVSGTSTVSDAGSNTGGPWRASP